VIGGTALFWLLAQSRFLDRYMSRGIHWSLRRWTDLDTRDYARLLNVHGSYRVNEIRVKKGDWLAGKRLRDCHLPDEGVTILGIYRSDGTYLGIPRNDTEIYAGDTVVLYGRSQALRDLTFRRDDPSGQRAHEAAVSDQKSHESRQARDETKYRRQRKEEDKE
jgi:NhaP-type Na+/H+ and K+/H+ antiporter